MGLFESLKTREGRRTVLVGDYDWNFLCMPRFPFCDKGKEYAPPPFYAHDEPLSLILAVMIGLQHALTMSTNIITPALLITNVVMSNFRKYWWARVINHALNCLTWIDNDDSHDGCFFCAIVLPQPRFTTRQTVTNKPPTENKRWILRSTLLVRL